MLLKSGKILPTSSGCMAVPDVKPKQHLCGESSTKHHRRYDNDESCGKNGLLLDRRCVAYCQRKRHCATQTCQQTNQSINQSIRVALTLSSQNKFCSTSLLGGVLARLTSADTSYCQPSTSQC